MNFKLLFDKINLWDAGREMFATLEERRADDDIFAGGIDSALLAFDDSLDAVKNEFTVLAESSGVKIQELILYVYLLRSEKTLLEYEKRGIDTEVFYESMLDLTMAARRCYEREGVYGIDAAVYIGWSRRVLLLEIFRIGRLEFEQIPSRYDCDIDGIVLHKGDPCINTHIPAYDPLTDEGCEDAYDRARVFFKKHFNNDNCIFICVSWFMHPWLNEDLGQSSAIVRFNEKYKVFEVVDDGTSPIGWVFREKCENPADYPENTSIQRKLKARLLDGRPVGYGVGVRL